MKSYRITLAEWRSIRASRGFALTGFPCHDEHASFADCSRGRR